MTAETQTEPAGPAIHLDPLGNRVVAEAFPAVRAYDFRNPVMLTEGQLAQLCAGLSLACRRNSRRTAARVASPVRPPTRDALILGFETRVRAG